MATITVEWALWSEKPGATTDYGLLSCSNGRLRSSHFKTIITRFHPGTPDGDKALPRVTVGAWDVAQQPYLGMAIQNISENYDGAGRKIAPTRFFAFPYASLAEQPVSYCDLYQELSALPLPETGHGQPFEVSVRPLDPAVIAKDLKEPDAADPVLTAVLSSLLQGRRVCLTQAEQASFKDRLRYLDVTAALLPYGYRAKLTATTWANSATQHKLRLFFSRRSADPQTTHLPWLGHPHIDVPQDAYLRDLRRLLHEHGPAEVIAHLAKETEARRFDEAGEAVRALHKVKARLERRRMLPHGTASPQELRNWLDGDDLAPQEAEACLRGILRLPEPDRQDLLRVTRWLPKVLERTGWEPWRQSLIGMISRLLWLEEDGPVVGMSDRTLGLEEDRPLYDLLSHLRRHEVDDFLAQVLRARPRPPQPEPSGRRLARAARLLLTGSGHDLAGLPHTQQILDGDVPLMLALIAELLAGSGGAEFQSAFVWVQDRLPEELRTLVTRLADPHDFEDISIDEVALLAGYGIGSLLLMLNIADQCRKFRYVGEAFLQWFIRQQHTGPIDNVHWGKELWLLEPKDPVTQAAVDVMLLAADRQPRWITDVPPQEWRDYQGTFSFAWERPWADKERMVEGLADCLRHQSWQDIPNRFEDVRRLLDELGLLSVPAIRYALEHGRLHEPWDTEWRQEAPSRSAPDKTQVLPPQDGAPPAVPGQSPALDRKHAQQALDFIVEMFQRSEHPETTYALLSQKHLLVNSDVAVEVVERLPLRIQQWHGSGITGQQWADALIEYLSTGRFEPNVPAADFQRAYLRRIMERMSDENRRLQKLNAFTKGRVFDDDKNHQQVASLVKALNELLGKKRSRGRGRGAHAKENPDSGKLLRRLKRGQGETAQGPAQ